MRMANTRRPRQAAAFSPYDHIAPLVTSIRLTIWPFPPLSDYNKLLVSCNRSSAAAVLTRHTGHNAGCEQTPSITTCLEEDLRSDVSIFHFFAVQMNVTLNIKMQQKWSRPLSPVEVSWDKNQCCLFFLNRSSGNKAETAEGNPGAPFQK